MLVHFQVTIEVMMVTKVISKIPVFSVKIHLIATTAETKARVADIIIIVVATTADIVVVEAVAAVSIAAVEAAIIIGVEVM